MIKDFKDAWGSKVYPRTTLKAVEDINGLTLEHIVRRPFVKGVNHRGFNTEAPENTLPAFILSFKKGFKYVECDVAFTSDNVAVLLHDSTINRTSQVSQYDFGSWLNSKYAGTKIPTLAEFLVLCRNLGLHPYIEIKSDTNYSQEQLQKIVDLVAAYGMKGNVTYISFSLSFLQSLKNIDSMARLGYLVQSVSSTTISDAKGLLTGFNEVFIDSSSYGSSVVSLCKDAGLPLEAWTINNEATIKSIDSYISGVTSDSLVMEQIVGGYSALESSSN